MRLYNFGPSEIRNKISGKKPCARDGHSAVIHKGHIIIFGGDRHRMSFNDMFIFNLEYANEGPKIRLT